MIVPDAANKDLSGEITSRSEVGYGRDMETRVGENVVFTMSTFCLRFAKKRVTAEAGEKDSPNSAKFSLFYLFSNKSSL